MTFVGLKWYKTTITTVLTSSSNTTTTTTSPPPIHGKQPVKQSANSAGIQIRWRWVNYFGRLPFLVAATVAQVHTNTDAVVSSALGHYHNGHLNVLPNREHKKYR